jgi:hypothetical protein
MNPCEIPHLQRSGAQGAPGGRGPQVSIPDATSNDGTPAPEIGFEVDMTTTADAVGMTSLVVEVVEVAHNTGIRVPKAFPLAGVASASGGAATTGDDDGDELEVVMGHPSLRAPG